ncbi:hypothetical protein [Noviherbaspirillum saxi]|uniref:Uncharacterized protein n=1 Tax=Noviherbaspirillum saxi TaxID=2320863 RepID=A0A3A3FJV9_9BURK|nr:hypothetical protein [Noviherbaspirillum saxi]RJF92678.1 hypothetical protein D3871_29290 [Noviherbaspirillum saxi]
MSLQIKRRDGSIVEIHDGTVRLKAQIQVYGTAEVHDPKTDTPFQVKRVADGSLAEATPPFIY